jgi:hypothetical protein
MCVLFWGVIWIGVGIDDLNRSTRERGPADQGVGAGRDRQPRFDVTIRGFQAKADGHAVQTILQSEDFTLRVSAKTHCSVEHGLQDGFEVEGRLADDL